MNAARITIWQCEDECCDGRSATDKWWLARSADFDFYEQVPSWEMAILLAEMYRKRAVA